MAETKWERVPQPTLDSDKRTTTFEEVNLNYEKEKLLEEAERCLQCKKPLCETGCPASNPIKEYIGLLRDGKIMEAVEVDRETNPFPSITGRVCSWESQCQGSCVVGNKGDAVNIGAIERWLGDYARKHPELEDYDVPSSTGFKVAIVGAGPAGMTVAHYLAREGHEVTMFEDWHLPGGVMAYGIPEFVLPQEIIDDEVERLKKYGVKLLTNTRVGEDVTVDELFERGYDAVFIGIGANNARNMGVPGEELDGIYTAKDFLMLTIEHTLKDSHPEIPEPDPVQLGDRVAVVGCGNTAMDAARTAVRFGADDVRIVYRRSEEQSPSRDCEVEHSLEEGVEFDYLVNPVGFIGDGNGRVKEMELIRMELGEPDSSGRARPIPIEGSEFTMEVDTVVLAIGYDPETDLYETMPDLETDKWDCIPVDEETGATNLEGVFAGGDIVTGPQTVVQAIAMGRRAAKGINEYLENK